MKKEARELIRLILDLDISEFGLFTGYKGDLMLRVTTLKVHTIEEIDKICKEKNISTEIKFNNINYAHEILCSFPQEEIYGLKRI